MGLPILHIYQANRNALPADFRSVLQSTFEGTGGLSNVIMTTIEKHIMRLLNLLQLFSLTLVIVFLAGCGNSLVPVEPTATSTPEPSTATPTPVPPTNTPTSLPPTPTPDQVHEMVFKTPEEAIIHYFEGMAQADTDKIFQTCAINEMSEKFRFDLYTERVRALMPILSLSPTDYPLYVETNKIQRSAQIFNRVKIFAFSLLSSEEVGEGKTIIIEDAERINNFMQDVDPRRLAQLEVEKIGLPDEALMNSDRYLKNAAALASIYGADESTERVALFSFEQNYYYLGFTLLRYGENWKISDQFSPLAGTNNSGAPEKTTVEEFEGMINGD
jgi:hypothetical protein